MAALAVARLDRRPVGAGGSNEQAIALAERLSRLAWPWNVNVGHGRQELADAPSSRSAPS